MKNRESLKEIIRYLMVGVLTTVVNLVIYYGLVFTCLNPNRPFELQLANVISWVFAVLFAYIANRIFVFKSKNEKKLREALSFFGSRIVTLLLDMGIMFFGVSILGFSDKIFKLISQVVVIVLNYVLSKVFVFRKKKKEKRKQKKFSISWQKYFDPILYYSLFLIPIGISIGRFLPSSLFKTIFFGVYCFYFLWFMIGLWTKKNGRTLSSILFVYLLIQVLYFICKNVDFLENTYLLMQIFLFPLGGLYFYYVGNSRIDERFFPKIFFEALFCSFLFFPTKVPSSLMGILVLTLPKTISSLIKHTNLLLKIIGTFFLVFFCLFYHVGFLALESFICAFLLWINKKNRKNWFSILVLILSILTVLFTWSMKVYDLSKGNISVEEFFFKDRLELVNHQNNTYLNQNIEEQIFGTSMVKEANYLVTKIDFADLFYFLGYVGFSVYLLLFLSFSYEVYVEKEKRMSMIFGLLFSIFEGSFLMCGVSGLYFGALCSKSKKEKKHLLLVSNMYPSKKFKHYGSFVKNCEEMLENLGFQVDKVVMKKRNHWVSKAYFYVLFYLKSFLFSFCYSYSYVYVHFVSHSAFGVLPSKWVCTKTKYVFNTHGNDIVADYEWEKRNVNRSHYVLSFADMVIAPSNYFKDVLKTEYKIKEEKIFVTPSGGVNLEVFHPIDTSYARSLLNLQENTFYIGFVGRIEKNKGWDTYLKGLKKITDHMKDVKGLVIGSGDEMNLFHEMVHRINLEEEIIEIPFVSQKELALYYNAFDVLIYPTRRKSESLGLIGIEAMASKCFVIGCNLYGPKEYLKDGWNSFTFQKEKDGSYLLKKVKEFRKMDLKKKEEMLQNAFSTASSYDSEVIKKDLEQIFK